MDIQRLKDILNKDGSYAIVVGNNYTIDEMGAALALQLALKTNGKNVSVVSGKQPLVEVSSLVGIDQVKSRFESSNGDLVVSFPYQEDEIGKVSYTLEAGFLNIIVKPKDNNTLSFGEKDVLFRRAGDIPAVLIAVGVKRISDLSASFDVEGLKDTVIINIDKVGNNEGYGDVVIMGQGASSVSEQVANLILTLGFPLDLDIAQNLMSGLMGATANFQSPKTSSLGFEMAGILMRAGARRESAKPAHVNNQAQKVMEAIAAQQNNRQNQSRANSAPRPIQQSAQNQEFAPVNPNQNMTQNQNRQPNPINAAPAQEAAPNDWLQPKIYKGSTNVE